jgi:hypothetical protein
MYSRNQIGYSGIDEGVSLLGGLLGIVIGVIVGVVLLAITMPVDAIKLLKRKRNNAVSQVPVMTSEADLQQSPSTVSPVEAPIGAADRVKQFQVGSIAKVHCRFYAEADVVARHVFFLTQEAIAKAGNRVELTPLKASETDQAQIERTTVQEINALLGVVESETSGNVIAKEASVENVGEGSHVEAATTPKPKAPNVRAARQRMASYQGVLLSACVQTRRTANSQYDAFCLTFDDEALGAEHQLWGADLERAIEESGAQVGDRVRVELVGETPTVVKGKTVTKKIWQVTKL